MGEDDLPPWVEILDRPALHIKDDTPDADLERELADRLWAAFESRGLEPTPEGWRELALELLIASKPAIPISTPVSVLQGGADGAGLDNFILRSHAKEIKRERNLKSNAAVAKVLARRPGETRTAGRIENILSRRKAEGSPEKSSDLWPRADRQYEYEQRVLRTLKKLAAEFEESLTN